MRTNHMSRRAFLRALPAYIGATTFVAMACEPVIPVVVLPVQNTPTPGSMPPMVEKITLTIWGLNQRMLTWFSEHTTALIEQSRVEIEVMPVADGSQMSALAASGTPSDILLVDPIIVGALERTGALVALGELADSAGVDLTPYWPAARQAFTSPQDGLLYALPVSGNYGPVAYFYNQEFFEEVGLFPPQSSWTVDELAEGGAVLSDATLRRDDGTWGARLYGLNQSYLTGYLRTFKGELLNDSGTEMLLQSEEAFTAVDWLYSLHTISNVLDFLPSDIGREELFLGGQVGIMNQTASWILSANNAIPNFTIGAEVPPAGVDNVRGTQAWAEGLAISTMSSDPALVIEVIASFTNQENGIAQAPVVGSPGARNDVWESEALNAIHPIFGRFAEIFPDGPDSLRLPVNPALSFQDFQAVLNQNLTSIWLGEMDVREGLDRANQECQALLERYIA